MAFALAPLPLLLDPTYFGLLAEEKGVVHNVAMVWLALGGAGLLFRGLEALRATMREGGGV